MSTKESILEVSKDKSLSERNIAEIVGCSRSTVRYWLSRLHRYESALVLNDLHIPFQDDKAVELCLKVGDILNPDKIFLNGDVLDNWQISRYTKQHTLYTKASLNHEIELGRSFLSRLVQRFPDSKIYYIYGNHEYRWDVFIDAHAKELAGLEGLSLGEQMHLPQLGIELVYSGIKESEYLWGKLLIGHFDLCRIASGYTAAGLIAKKAISLIQGHSHRGGAHFKRTFDRTLVGYENFCLTDLNPPYVNRPDWQQGFSIVHKETKSDLFHVDQYPILNINGVYRVFYQGEVFEV